MNIIYFNTHDSGRYLSPYGYKVPSENINEFARDAILFRNAYCTTPTCTPSRGALLTGMYPHSNGLMGLSHRGFKLRDYKKHIGFLLKKHGYSTAIAGTEHIANHGLFTQHDMNYDVLPYDDVIGPAGETNDLDNAKSVAKYIKNYNTESGKFFISFGLWSTHRKYPEKITPGYEPNYIKVPSTMKDTPENREDFAHYCTSLKVADECFGIVLEALKEKGVYEDTLIIFTTDHGLASPFMKGTLTDAGLGVALIMKIPGEEKKGMVIDSMFSHIDLFPTICDLIDIEKPDWLQGMSQLPVIQEKKEKVRKEIFAETNYHASYEPMRCIRTENYKYIRIYHDYTKPMLANIDDSKPKDLLLSRGFQEYKVEKEYLFDLDIDPNERENRIHDIKYQEILQCLSKKLSLHMERTKDFIESKNITHPKGIAISSPDALNPKDKLTITN